MVPTHVKNSPVDLSQVSVVQSLSYTLLGSNGCVACGSVKCLNHARLAYPHAVTRN